MFSPKIFRKPYGETIWCKATYYMYNLINSVQTSNNLGCHNNLWVRIIQKKSLGCSVTKFDKITLQYDKSTKAAKYDCKFQ